MKASLILAAMLLALLAAPTATLAESNCEPYPIGRCGAEDRERVVFCYRVEGNLIVGASAEAVTLEAEDKQVLHVRTQPTTDLALDVMNAPLPFESIYRETNAVDGLQTQTLTCATFEWWEECLSWMGPYNEFVTGPDEQIF